MKADLDHSYQVLDVFTDTPLQGNPLAVFTDAELIPQRLMQSVARELNLSETVFVLPGDAERCDAELRIFTPATELPFAGHPTLGAAFVVGARDDLDLVRLGTGAGVVPVRLIREDAEIVYGEMDQPIPTVEPYRDSAALLAALGVDPAAVALPIERYVNGPAHVIVALDSVDTLVALAPDMGALTAIGPDGVAVVAMVTDGAVKTRNFCPGLGVPEDPATGSAAGPVALHLARHGWAAYDEPILVDPGAESGRPSRLVARACGSAEHPAPITVGGSAVRVASGVFRIA